MMKMFVAYRKSEPTITSIPELMKILKMHIPEFLDVGSDARQTVNAVNDATGLDELGAMG